METRRLSCFLCYCEAYRAAMERVRSLLRVLDFDVTVFDAPDQRPPQEVIDSEIEQADLVVVLLGPDFRLDGDPSQPAGFPHEEAVIASAKNKRIALIVHPGTRIPHMLEAYQTPARFDFLDAGSYADNAHHIVKHLLDAKRGFDIAPGDSPYYFQRASFKFRIHRRGYIEHDVYHQVVARQLWSDLRHAVDTGPDRTESARLVVNKDDVELAATMGATGHALDISWSDANQHEQWYVVTFSPPIPPGGQVGYRRMFELDNFFPLTAQALASRAAEPGFPAMFRQANTVYYGTSFEIHSEMEKLSVAFQFPATVDVHSTRAVAVVTQVQRINDQETIRINAGDVLTTTRSAESGDTTIALEVGRPLANHTYLLLYEPGG